MVRPSLVGRRLAGGGVVGAADPGFSIEERDDGGLHVVLVCGELDLGTAPQLRERLHAAIAAGHTDIAVDLAGMGFMDSSGISVLVDGLKLMQRREGRLVLRAPTAGTRRVLEIAGLVEIFGVADEPPT